MRNFADKSKIIIIKFHLTKWTLQVSYVLIMCLLFIWRNPYIILEKCRISSYIQCTYITSTLNIYVDTTIKCIKLLLCSLVYRICVTLKKGQCQEIFASGFFHYSSSPNRLKITLWCFFFIRDAWCCFCSQYIHIHEDSDKVESQECPLSICIFDIQRVYQSILFTTALH